MSKEKQMKKLIMTLAVLVTFGGCVQEDKSLIEEGLDAYDRAYYASLEGDYDLACRHFIFALNRLTPFAEEGHELAWFNVMKMRRDDLFQRCNLRRKDL